jgi:8-oxo-dGTP diphosphatase
MSVETISADSPADAAPRRASDSSQGTIVDAAFRGAFRVAHRVLRTWWMIRRPRTHGALVAMWNEGRVLLVKNSYRREYTFPGGYVRPGESAIEAAMRELVEEVGVEISSSALKEVYDGVENYENRRDRVTIVEVEVQRPPEIAVDRREVVWAEFTPPDDVLALPIVPHLRRYLNARS